MIFVRSLLDHSKKMPYSHLERSKRKIILMAQHNPAVLDVIIKKLEAKQAELAAQAEKPYLAKRA
jgi:hypothetical protein